MSIETMDPRKVFRFPAVKLPKWPKLHLFRHLCNAMEAYAAAISMSYGAAFGLDSQSLTRKPSERDHNL